MFHFEKIKIEYFQKFENDHDCRGRGVLGGGGGGMKRRMKENGKNPMGRMGRQPSKWDLMQLGLCDAVHLQTRFPLV